LTNKHKCDSIRTVEQAKSQHKNEKSNSSGYQEGD
jgi:hypothetical protein